MSRALYQLRYGAVQDAGDAMGRGTPMGVQCPALGVEPRSTTF